MSFYALDGIDVLDGKAVLAAGGAIVFAVVTAGVLGYGNVFATPQGLVALCAIAIAGLAAGSRIGR